MERYIASQYMLDGVVCGVFCKYPHGMEKISANYLGIQSLLVGYRLSVVFRGGEKAILVLLKKAHIFIDHISNL